MSRVTFDMLTCCGIKVHRFPPQLFIYTVLRCPLNISQNQRVVDSRLLACSDVPDCFMVRDTRFRITFGAFFLNIDRVRSGL